MEIVGLCKSIVTWLSKCYEEKNFPYEGVLFKGMETYLFVNIPLCFSCLLRLVCLSNRHTVQDLKLAIKEVKSFSISIFPF